MSGLNTRMIGNSYFVDDASNREFHNSWIIEGSDVDVTVQVGAIGNAKAGKELHTSDRRTRWFLEEVRREMQRAKRDQIPVTPIPKPNPGRRRRRFSACPECNGAGETYVDDRLIPCPQCVSESGGNN